MAIAATRIEITPTDGALGAIITGVDASRPRPPILWDGQDAHPTINVIYLVCIPKRITPTLCTSLNRKPLYAFGIGGVFLYFTKLKSAVRLRV